MSKKKTNYDKAVAIYEAKGQSAVFDAILDGTLKVDYWAECEPCETESPIEDEVCLVCGTPHGPIRSNPWAWVKNPDSFV